MLAAPADVRAAVAALVVGYGAGVAAGLSLRPRIGVASIAFATVMPALAAMARLDAGGMVLGVVILALLGGGVQSMVGRYLGEIEKIDLRGSIAGLARVDHLTAAAKRLGLAEAFGRTRGTMDGGATVALRCIDLDRFKPVNDL